MKALKVPVGGEPQEIEIEPTLAAVPANLNSYIEIAASYPSATGKSGIMVFGKEEAAILGEPLNRYLWPAPDPENISPSDLKDIPQIYGDFLICGFEDDQLRSLTDEEIDSHKRATSIQYPDLEALIRAYDTDKVLSEAQIRKMVESSCWDDFSAVPGIPESVIRPLADWVDWNWISQHQTLSEPFIREFQDRVDWGRISRYQSLSGPFIREFADRVDWIWISRYQALSEPFIREFAGRVDWKYISHYQTLSEPFIREFADRVDWLWISCYQALSEPFIREFREKINWKALTRNPNIKLSDEFRSEFADRLK